MILPLPSSVLGTTGLPDHDGRGVDRTEYFFVAVAAAAAADGEPQPPYVVVDCVGEIEVPGGGDHTDCPSATGRPPCSTTTTRISTRTCVPETIVGNRPFGLDAEPRLELSGEEPPTTLTMTTNARLAAMMMDPASIRSSANNTRGTGYSEHPSSGSGGGCDKHRYTSHTSHPNRLSNTENFSFVSSTAHKTKEFSTA